MLMAAKRATTHPSKKRAGITADSKIPFTPERGKLLSPREAAAQLGITERQMRRLREERLLPCVKVKGLYRFKFEDIEAFIEANTTPAQ
jgi:excisionase family DNA binding protein